MTTLVVITPTLDGRDGLSCLSRDVTAALGRLPGIAADVEVIALAGTIDEEAGRPRVCGCRGSRWRFVWAALGAASRRPSVVVVMHAHLLPLSLPFLVSGSKLVAVLVGIEAWRRFGPLRAWLLRLAHARIAVSSHTRRRFVEANPALAGEAIDVCRPSAPPLAGASGAGPMPPGYALIVGRLSSEERYKGHDLLIDVWTRVRQAHAGARLVIAGDGDDRPRLQQKVAEAGLDEAVAFLGRVPNQTLAALYRDAAVFVLPSLHEGFGYVFLEAMASGTPCIGASGAAEEIIEDGVSGFVVDPSDAPAVASTIVRLLDDRDLGQRMGLAGVDRVRRVFAPDRLAGDLGAVLERVLAC